LQRSPNDMALLWQTRWLTREVQELREKAATVETSMFKLLSKIEAHLGIPDRNVPNGVGFQPASTPPEGGTALNALHDYKPAYPDELELTAGDELTFVSQTEPGWWCGRQRGTGKVSATAAARSLSSSPSCGTREGT